MKEPELQDWACRLLEDQLMRLAELRNANPRDSGFKLWRQTSLTVIQRVWPGNLPRSERFRRIPFTPATARPSRAQVREHFEKGCAEATAFLRELISEIENSGLDRDGGPSQSETPTVVEGTENLAEKLAAPLPGELSRPATGEIEKSAPLPREAPPPIPGFLSSSAAAAPGTAPPAPPPAPRRAQPAPPSLAAAPAPQAPAAEGKRPAAGKARSPRKSERRALKEMLGFVEEQATPPPPAPIEVSREAERPSVSFQGPSGPPPVQAPPVISSAPPLPAPTPLEEEQDEEVLLEDDTFAEEGEPTMGEDPEEMLRSAPWTAAHTPTPAPAAPATQVTHAVDVTRKSPVAAALLALASEVAELGVPEGKRAAARAGLTDLARQIEDRTADWDTLRDAFHLAMNYPPMARRVIPLLLPFLDLR